VHHHQQKKKKTETVEERNWPKKDLSLDSDTTMAYSTVG